jgi:large subunit ribosomal protein L25
MKSTEIKATLREKTGKNEAVNLRRAEQVPCVLYGGAENVHFYVDEKIIKKIIFTPDVFVAKINVNGNQFQAVVQDSQFHPVSDKVVHVDFIQIFDDKPVTVSLPVALKGSSPGVLEGGKLVMNARKLKVKGLPGKLPESIIIDISELAIGGFIRVKDVNIDGVTILEAENNVLVAVKASRKSAQAAVTPAETK